MKHAFYAAIAAALLIAASTSVGTVGVGSAYLSGAKSHWAGATLTPSGHVLECVQSIRADHFSEPSGLAIQFPEVVVDARVVTPHVAWTTSTNIRTRTEGTQFSLKATTFS